MKKIFLKLTDEKSGYGILDEARTIHFLLGQLVMFLERWGHKDPKNIYTSKGMYWEWLCLDKTEDGKYVFLWDHWKIKDQAKKKDLSEMEQDAFEAAYDDYVEQRREDIPKLYMMTENYVEIVQKWQEIVLKQQPNYIVILQDDIGHVDLIGKNELSEQDLKDIKREHEKYLKYKTAYDKYTKSRPDIVDELWHGPESSEYEAGWQKFLDEPLN